MEKCDNVTSLNHLPDELITLILVNTEPRDITNFGATCKQFHAVVSNNDYLWKKKYSEIISSSAVIKLVCELVDGNWLTEIINFYKLKQNICLELLSMSPQYYWRIKELAVTDVGGFFAIATKKNLNYYYTIYILQEIVKKGSAIIATNKCQKPLYTLTTIYYAKIVLSYLIHTYLALKWLQKHLRNELTPVFVTNFFLQWIDITKIYSDDDVEHKIEVLVKKVHDILGESPSKLKLVQHKEEKKYTEKQLLHAISKAIYNNNYVSDSPSIKTLNIVKVVDEDAGNVISVGAIYQVVANYFGLKCELIAFPNHLFLEWQCNDEPNNPLYTIDLFNGVIKPKRRCPFAHGNPTKYEYCPDSLLQFIYSSYMKSKGSLKNCKTQNAIRLWDFFGVKTDYRRRPYKTFFLHLVAYDCPQAKDSPPVNLKYMDEVHRDMIILLSGIKESLRGGNRKIVIKKRPKTIMYAVGMICYHNIHNYICVVRGWEVDCTQLTVHGLNKLQYGKEQPLYCVMAGDQSERFVAQENLKPVNLPFRIEDLEDCLAKEFTHFDGFSYVLNQEKQLEYPEEKQYIDVFKKYFSS